MPVPQQLPQISVLLTRHPDLRKVILHHEFQYQLGILSIRFLFAYSLALDLGRVSNPQLKLKLRQQSFEPACLPAGLHAHTHPLARSPQATIELLCFLAMG